MFEKLIYLSSPHSHPDPMVREIRYQQVMKATAQLIRDGRLVYSPIVHTHEMGKVYAFPKVFDFYAQLDYAWIERVNEVWVLMIEGWDESDGVRAEIQRASKIGKVIQMVGWSDRFGVGEITELRDGFALRVDTGRLDFNSGKQQPFEYDPKEGK
jgi:hypothetical protein